MARNFGIRRPTGADDRAPIWPLVLMTAIVISVINAATLLHHR
jgi:hypothetical protein